MCFARFELRPDMDAVIMMLLGKAFTKLKVFSLIKTDDETITLLLKETQQCSYSESRAKTTDICFGTVSQAIFSTRY